MTRDEIDLVRAIRPEEGPYDPLNRARARARMLDGNARPPRRRRRWTVTLALTAAATTAVATVVGVGVGVGGGAPDRRGSGPATEAPPDARQMVLAAAHQAERRPAGRYLTVHDRHCFSLPVKHRVGTYFIATCNETWKWQARDRPRDSAIWSRDLARHPLTPRDRTLWKKAGSPRTFPYPDLPASREHQYKIGGTPWREGRTDRNESSGKFFVSGTGEELSARQIQELPTDPGSLRRVFLPDRRLAGGRKEPVGAGQDIVRLGSAVSDLPLPPRVWGGLIRLLTETPGVRAVGRVTDPIGRAGVALEAPRSMPASNGRGAVTFMERIIFAPDTGEFLASVSTTVNPGGDRPALRNSDVRISATWSEKRPGSPPR
ncbi:CU044_5270 family protein [Actinomadura kijaniata]|uniref:CU044_5270 family protein n=1 Tax=Actinomadura kijaniata TaxID=46161 RepID=UPI003F1ADF58